MNKILVISGISGIGKSKIAYKISEILNTEIVVLDSLQV